MRPLDFAFTEDRVVSGVLRRWLALVANCVGLRVARIVSCQDRGLPGSWVARVREWPLVSRAE